MTWETFVIHTSTEQTISKVIHSRARHFERYAHTDRCPDAECDMHPDPLFEIDPDQGHVVWWRAS